MNVWKQLRAILLRPGMVTVVIPATILYRTGITWPPSMSNIVIGCRSVRPPTIHDLLSFDPAEREAQSVRWQGKSHGGR